VHNQPVIPDPVTSAFRVPMVRMPQMSAEDLIARMHQGHADALPVLFDRFHRLVLKIALSIVRDPGEAEDVMQDVFFEIFNKAGQFDPAKGSAKTWVLQYAYHRSLSRRQYLALRGFYDRRQITESEVAESNSRQIFWRGLTFQEWRRVIEQGLATLNENQRRTLMLVCFEGLLLTEIAERTKETVANVRHHYYRGLEGLRTFLHVSEARHDEF
jgi:RNA polymerase sigma-70 factor, ECF subfamily